MHLTCAPCLARCVCYQLVLHLLTVHQQTCATILLTASPLDLKPPPASHYLTRMRKPDRVRAGSATGQPRLMESLVDMAA